MRLIPLAVLSSLFLPLCSNAADVVDDIPSSAWVELFNGKNLDNWTVKVSGFPVGENAFDTFRVADGLLQVRYDKYDEFKDRFAHIFSNAGSFSHYRLQLEYRFVGEQMKGGPVWGLRNNGLMFHSQSAESMELNQWFPNSMEYQFLGSDDKNQVTTANLCTPGTHAVFNGVLRTEHCTLADSESYVGEQWVSVELEVHGSEWAVHRVNGKPVLEYTGLQLDDGTPLSEGFIALQAESHPTDFRHVRLLNLKGCMDKAAKNFKPWFVASAQETCEK